MQNLSRAAAGLAGSVLGALISLQPAIAFTFDQTEVSQDKFVAIAVPITQGKSYNLLILEQISDSQKCWQEDAAQPGVVDPLLLKFDFSGICGRSTDSNGYSIRVAGKDLGLDYKLSVRKRGDALTLVGYSYKDARAPELEIGHTTQTGDGFLKIELAPGWRFAKRAYDGKTLGHIYLTRDTFPETTRIASQTKPQPTVAQPSETAPNQPVSDRSKSRTRTKAAAVSGKRRSKRKTSKSAFTKPISIPVPTPGISAAKRLPVPKAASIPLTPPKISVPGAGQPAGRTVDASKSVSPAKAPAARATVAQGSSPFTTPIQIPVPQPRSAPPESSTPRQYQAPTAASTSGLPTLTPNVLPVPGGAIPLGNAQNRANVYQGGLASAEPVPSDGSPPAPPIQVAWVSHRYRVVVPANASQHSTVKSLVPDAFRATYKGQPVMQVGAYKTQGEADNMMQFLSQKGVDAVVEQR